MSWRDWFVSRHTLFLEREIEDLKKRHEANIAAMEKTHADQLAHVITESNRYREDAERIRLYLTPALQSVQLEPDKAAPPSPAPDTYTGTPWMRILQREIARQEKEAAARFTKPVEGEFDGNPGEGRVSTPLSQPSKPS